MDQRRGAERSLKLLIPSRYRHTSGRQLSSTSNGRREEREEEGKGEGEEKLGERQRERRLRGALCRSRSQGMDRQHQPLLSLFPISYPERPLARVPPEN